MSEYKNICSKCGAENTLYPYFWGKKRAYKCEACEELSNGITKKEWILKKYKVRKSDRIDWKATAMKILEDLVKKTSINKIGSEYKCPLCGEEIIEYHSNGLVELVCKNEECSYDKTVGDILEHYYLSKDYEEVEK